MDDVTTAINHFSVLLEDQNAKLDAVLESQRDQATGSDIQRLEHRLDAIASEVQTVKAALTATNRDVTGLDHRVTRLETA